MKLNILFFAIMNCINVLRGTSFIKREFSLCKRRSCIQYRKNRIKNKLRYTNKDRDTKDSILPALIEIPTHYEELREEGEIPWEPTDNNSTIHNNSPKIDPLSPIHVAFLFV
jgi:hypothetical protein